MLYHLDHQFRFAHLQTRGRGQTGIGKHTIQIFADHEFGRRENKWVGHHFAEGNARSVSQRMCLAANEAEAVFKDRQRLHLIRYTLRMERDGQIYLLMQEHVADIDGVGALYLHLQFRVFHYHLSDGSFQQRFAGACYANA